MFRHFSIALLIALGTVISPPSTGEQAPPTLVLLTEENAPYSFLDTKSGEIKGTGVELVTEMLNRAGYAYSIKLLPWKRAFRRAQETENTCLFLTNRTSAREPLFSWVGPLFEGGWAVFKRPNSEITITNVKDLPAFTIVGKSNSASVDEIEGASGAHIMRTVDDETAARVLYHGRADLWVSGVIDAPLAARTSGLPVPELALLWKRADMSMACSKLTSPAIIQTLNQINQDLDELRKSALARHSMLAPSSQSQ